MEMALGGGEHYPLQPTMQNETEPTAGWPTAHISRLQLSGFRSWAGIDLKINARPVVITGPNGSGKTNILEAISYLNPGRGLLGARTSDLSRRQSNSAAGWAVSADIDLGTNQIRIGAGTQKDKIGRERRIFQLDGEATSPSDIAESLRLAWLTPAMDRLFVESAGTRRRFFDRLIAALVPSHGQHLNRYEKAMAERNRLLKEGSSDPAWLSALEQTLAEEGVAITAARSSACAGLCQEIKRLGPWYETTLFPEAGLALDCEINTRLAGEPAVRVEEWLMSELATSRARDAAAGRTLTGPHRADWRVSYIAKDCPADLASAGEQKALLINIVLAHLNLVAAGWGRMPILLLDEIAAGLDERRREALFQAILDLKCQAWITATDLSVFNSLAGQATFIDTSQAESLGSDHLI